MFFETIVEHITQQQKAVPRSFAGQSEGASFAFKIDYFNLCNPTSDQEVKKIPITKIYPAMTKPTKKRKGGPQHARAPGRRHGSM